MTKPYYEDDHVRIFHGDCREIDEWLAADVLITDPPYGMRYRSGWDNRRIDGDLDTKVRDEALAKWGGAPSFGIRQVGLSTSSTGTPHVDLGQRGLAGHG